MEETEARSEPVTPIDWAKLTAPVPAEDIEYLPKAGKKFAYMTAQFVRRRLDEVVQGRWNWTFETVGNDQHGTITDGEPFVIIGHLSIWNAGGEFGGDSIRRMGIGTGDTYKAAETDAFKRAAQRLGIGNELYEMDAAPLAISRLVVMGGAAAAAPKATPAAPAATTTEALPVIHAECPVCQGPMWDNRVNKKNPKSPDFSCKQGFKVCKGAYWKQSDVPEAMWADGFLGKLDEDDDDAASLPF